jgi:anti-sigma-K factor RskA
MADANLPIPQLTSRPKSIFQSKTFWGAVLTAVAAVAPVIAKSVSDYQENKEVDPQGIANIVVVLATTSLTIIGRVDANNSGPVYTPQGTPGPNKEHLESQTE